MGILQDVLVPIDGSDPSERAIDYALRLAKSEQAEVTFCHVVNVEDAVRTFSVPYGSIDVPSILEGLKNESERLLSQAVASAAEHGIKAEALDLPARTQRPSVPPPRSATCRPSS